MWRLMLPSLSMKNRVGIDMICWRPEIKDAMEKIRHLNARVQAYAEKNNIPYVDYFSAMVTSDGKEMMPSLAQDTPGVHPNAAGYKIMEGLLLPVIEQLR